jgi:hypothetical protein
MVAITNLRISPTSVKGKSNRQTSPNPANSVILQGLDKTMKDRGTAHHYH